jgi:myo-inositol-1-phosphate synthase
MEIKSDKVNITEKYIFTEYDNYTNHITTENNRLIVTPIKKKYFIRTERKVAKLGVMLVGWGGNNGTTLTAGILANKHYITWHNKNGKQIPNYYGSLTQASTVKIGNNEKNEEIYVPFNSLLPMVNPNDLVIGGWDISKMNLADAMDRAQVLDHDLKEKLRPYMKDFVPLPSIYYPDFIATNQAQRADNILEGDKLDNLTCIRQDIRDFKKSNNLEKVIIIWTANTERFCDVREGINDTWNNLMKAISNNAKEISPSTIFAVASILQGCSYINGSPQNTFVPGVIELAEKYKVFIAGDDLKTGQTKLKSVLVDFLISAGIKPESIVSYNFLGNNDGKNLSEQSQFKSKEITKSNVIQDMVKSNQILYKKDESPDHCVDIKYIPYVGDSKRAIDEYISRIFLNGHNTMVIHNTCEDSLLAAPLILDLIIFTELLGRISFMKQHKYESMSPVLGILSYWLKAPLVCEGTPVINSLFKQREAITNLLRICRGLKPENYMGLQYKI